MKRLFLYFVVGLFLTGMSFAEEEKYDGNGLFVQAVAE